MKIDFNGKSIALEAYTARHLLPNKQVVEQLLRLAEKRRRPVSANRSTTEENNSVETAYI